jgi:hypothetical protein
MKALFLCDTHWLWYAAGKKKSDFRRPRVDYLSLRDKVTNFLIKRFGRIYTIECHAFVTGKRNVNMVPFVNLLQGFGYIVHETDSAFDDIADMLETSWDLVVLAVGNESHRTIALNESKRTAKRVLIADFLDDVDIELSQEIFYEAKQ